MGDNVVWATDSWWATILYARQTILVGGGFCSVIGGLVIP